MLKDVADSRRINMHIENKREKRQKLRNERNEQAEQKENEDDADGNDDDEQKVRDKYNPYCLLFSDI